MLKGKYFWFICAFKECALWNLKLTQVSNYLTVRFIFEFKVYVLIYHTPQNFFSNSIMPNKECSP